jgi:signal transduction histidine kinase
VSERPDEQDRLAEVPGIGGASRERLSLLVEQQAALRRVATLVARGVSASHVFSAVADEMVRCVNANAAVHRLEGDTLIIVAAAGFDPGAPSTPVVGERFSVIGSDNIAAMVLRTGRAARVDSHENAAGPIAARLRELGLHSVVAAPIVVDGRVWGLASVGAPERLSSGTEERLGDFAELVATAIANAATRDELQTSRDQLRELAEQQAALRRVATLVARGVSPSEVFAAVADEVARCLDIDNVAMSRFEGDEVAVVALSRTDPGMKNPLFVGERSTLDGDNITTRVFRTGRAARLDGSEAQNASGPIAERLREMELGCMVGVPIVVNSRLWGMVGVGASTPEVLPADTEVRLGDFADLVGTAIANAATHDELIASRARIVAAADEARRRLERDLHDGAQQQLVSLGLQLRLAESSVPPELQSLKEQLSGVVSGVTAVASDLQEISRGIHPAILSDGGLAPALKTLARRCPIPAKVDALLEGRLRESVEIAAYYVVAEALTNAAKYANASEVNVCAQIQKDNLCLSIGDDGIGGADPRKGSGLIGLKDRVEALGGHVNVISAPGSGTSLHVTIPLT